MEIPFVPTMNGQAEPLHQTSVTRRQEVAYATSLTPTDHSWGTLPSAVRTYIQRQLAEATYNKVAALTGRPVLDTVMQQLLTAVATVAPSDAGCIILFEQSQGRIAYTRGFTSAANAFFQTYRFALTELIPDGIIANTRPYLVPDTRAWPDWIPLAVSTWIRSSMGVPLTMRGQIIGLLVLDSATPYYFQPSDLDKLQAFVQGASLALENAYHLYLLEEQVISHAGELKAAKAQVELLHAFIDAMPDAIYIKDRQHRFILRNSHADHSPHDADLQEAIGKTDFAFYPPALAETFHLQEEVIFTTGQPLLRHEMPLVREDGTILWLAVTKVPLRNPKGEIVGLAGFSYDITARKQSEEALRASEARYRLLADNITDMVCRLNPSIECMYVSPSSAAILGYAPAEMIGQSGLAFVHPVDLPLAQQALLEAQEQNEATASIRLRLRHKQGHYVWLELSGRAIIAPESKELLEFVVSARDVTQQKQAEDALQAALQKAQEVNELKSRFLSMASHEFRTPLTSILLMAETLRVYRHKLTSEQIEQRLGTICKQVEHLKTIIEDVLELTCIQARRVEFHPLVIDLDAFCRTVVDELQPQAEDAPRLLYQCDSAIPLIKLDKRLMRQVITNLVTNAVKYAPGTTAVLLRLAYTGTDLVLQVTDSGIGIPDTDLPHLFQPFHRASNVGAIPGTGLGLVIMKEAVELHGGTVVVTSAVGKGTTFTVSLPVADKGVPSP